MVEGGATSPLRVVVVGGGVGGLATALALGRAGHQVTVLERDRPAAVDDAEAAFAAERRGAPQVAPDPRLPRPHRRRAAPPVPRRARRPARRRVHDPARRARPGRTAAGRRGPGGPRHAPHDLRVGAAPRGGAPSPASSCARAWRWPGCRPRRRPGRTRRVVDGVRLDDGSVVPADVVVAATGRRDQVVTWLADVGADVAETVVPSGLVYLSRWYRLPPGDDHDRPQARRRPRLPEVPRGARRRRHAVDHPGGARPPTATCAGPSATPTASSRRAGCCPGPDQFFAHGPLDPLGGVRPMGGLRQPAPPLPSTADGAPVALGFHAVGDAHTCTNPLYGRGCSLALVQAGLLADAVAAHPDDPAARAAAYEDACRARGRALVRPVRADRRARGRPAAVATADAPAQPAGAGDDRPVRRGRRPTRSSAGRWPACGTCWPCRPTSPPTRVTAARMLEVMADPDAYPPPRREGPTRVELLAALTSIPDSEPDDPEALAHG